MFWILDTNVKDKKTAHDININFVFLVITDTEAYNHQSYDKQM